ncbi:MAG TPA: cyclic nucleotide-binding domain-containing protein [Treponemataceae bacterium]|nr:cyclic nucleotide-binding domain-containing protein [Treponemataceae bacterium]
MPKAIQFKPNSVIYFAGDVDDRVFLLQKGRVALTSTDIETGKQVTDYIREGEFFGVKSALGHFPREESVMVITDSHVLSFSTIEFESFVQTNTRIIMKMLKVFSNQLRNIHRQIESLLHSKEETNQDDGMFSVASCFYKSQQYRAASEVATRYLKLFPTGKHVQEMKAIAENTLKSTRPFGGHTSGDASNTIQESRKSGGPVGNDPNLALTLAEGLAKQGKWDEAYKQYHSVIEAGPSPALGKAYVGAGKSLYEQHEYVRTLQLLTTYISSDPKSLQIGEVLMYMGLAYDKMEQSDKAKAFLSKALSMADPKLVPQIKEHLASVGG